MLRSIIVSEAAPLRLQGLALSDAQLLKLANTMQSPSWHTKGGATGLPRAAQMSHRDRRG
jgi:hypothetical protein